MAKFHQEKNEITVRNDSRVALNNLNLPKKEKKLRAKNLILRSYWVGIRELDRIPDLRQQVTQ